MAAVRAAGHAAPRYAVTADAYREEVGTFRARGVTRKGVPAWDEDKVTLAVAAGRRATAHLEAPSGVDLVVFATGGPQGGASTVVEALGLDAGAEDHTGSRASGVQALVRAADHADATGGSALVVAADAPRAPPTDPAEHVLGAGAAALLVAPEGPLEVRTAASASGEALGRDRTSPGGLREPGTLGRRTGELLQAAWSRLEDPPAKIGIACVAPHRHGLPVEAGTEASVREVAGRVPAAEPLLALLEAGPAEGRVLLAAGDADRASVVLLGSTGPLPGAGGVRATWEALEPIPVVQAIRERRLLPPTPPPREVPMGAYVSREAFHASLPARYRLEAHRCAACDALHYPPRATCHACGSRDAEPERLTGRGTLASHTVIGRGGAPSEFASEQDHVGAYAVGIVELEEGPRVACRLADRDPDAWSIGDPLEPVFRRLYEQEGAVRYGLKWRLRAEG